MLGAKAMYTTITRLFTSLISPYLETVPLVAVAEVPALGFIGQQVGGGILEGILLPSARVSN